MIGWRGKGQSRLDFEIRKERKKRKEKGKIFFVSTAEETLAEEGTGKGNSPRKTKNMRRR